MDPRIRVSALLRWQGRILLCRQEKPGKEYWLLPGGGVDSGESLIEAPTLTRLARLDSVVPEPMRVRRLQAGNRRGLRRVAPRLHPRLSKLGGVAVLPEAPPP